VKGVPHVLQRLRAVKIQHELHRASGFHSLWRVMIGDLCGAIKFLREKTANPLPGSPFLVFTVKNGAPSSQS
jgi:hypothetical protein